ncbi:hypothetical protein WJX72_007902 [[Myrmecia] bisecta]|uniref:Biopterin transport-related protein BT1 n=1 Tax=[Myrmecia] bisecta TaxID=41462 RepID=A0AAW1Q1H6_9CHLO
MSTSTVHHANTSKETENDRLLRPTASNDAEVETGAASFSLEDGHHTPEPLATQTSWLHRHVRPFGLDPSPELLAVSIGYFVQGNRQQMVKLAEQYFLKDILLMDPAKAEMCLAIVGLPWIVKPLYGLCTDSFPLFGYRRRSYLAACGLTGSLAYFCLGSLAKATMPTLLLLTLSELSIAFSDVVIDGVVVERSRGEPQATAGALQSVCWGSQATGSMLSAYAGGRLIGWAGPRPVFLLMSFMTLLISAAALMIREERWGAPASICLASRELHHHPSGDKLDTLEVAAEVGGSPIAKRALFSDAAHALQTSESPTSMPAAPPRLPAVMMPALFILLWQGSPSTASAMFYFYTEKLHFSPDFLGTVRVLEGAGQMLGVWLFNRFLRTIALRRLLLGLGLAGGALGLTQLVLVTGLNRKLGLSDELFCLADSAVLAAMVRVALMPVFVIAARVCPKGIEACFYSFLMSISNAGNGLASALGSGLMWALGVTATNFDNLPLLVLICTVLGMLPLFALFLVPRDVTSNNQDEADP